jgi:hypothetical protein
MPACLLTSRPSQKDQDLGSAMKETGGQDAELTQDTIDGFVLAGYPQTAGQFRQSLSQLPSPNRT